MHLYRRAFFRSILWPLAALLLIACGIPAREKPAAARTIRVLFVGNSYTYFNNLPEMFSKLADAGGQSRVEYRMEAPGGWRLKDHWEKGDALKALHDSRWDYVVLQEQSTLGINYFVEGKPRVSNDSMFKPYASKWVAEVRKAGATAIFYLTWARKATPEDQRALNYAYMQAAKEGGAQVAPVGLAWERVRERQPEIELFFTDGSHPSPAGSFLAACTLYCTIFHRNPAGLPGKISGVPVNLSTAKAEPGKNSVLVELQRDQAEALQAAAWMVQKKLEADGGYEKVAAPPLPGVAPLPSGE